MKKFKLHILSILVVLSLVSGLVPISAPAHAQDQKLTPTVGVISGDHAGYTLFRAASSNRVYLIDSAGRLVNEWTVSGPGKDAFLRENGNLLVSVAHQTPPEHDFAGGTQFVNNDGRFEEYSWDGELVWAYEFDWPNYRTHHGVTPLPNGNIMFIAFEYKTNEEAIAAGRNPELLGSSLWPDAILEYSPTENAIVWEWHVWDHLIQDFDPAAANYANVAENPQLVDINFFEPPELIEDWMHVNAIDYNPQLDQIVISVREFNEFWIIDHSTTTEEARGAAGDLLYRWGNPRAYQQGAASQHYLGYQHDVQWIPEGYPGAGNIILYSNRHALETTDENGEITSLNYSKIIEMTPPLQADGTYAREAGQAFGPAEPTWSYDGLPDNRFYSLYVSGVQRLPNGNTLITQGGNTRIFEVTPDEQVAWDFVAPLHGQYLVTQGSTPQTLIFRARRYQPDFGAFVGRDLTPSIPLEVLASTSPDYPAYINLDETIEAELAADLPERYYVFNVEPGQTVTVAMDAPDNPLIPDLQLIDATLQPLAEDVSEDAISAKIEDYRITTAGTYTIIAKGANEDATTLMGRFQLQLLDRGNELNEVDADIPRLVMGTVFLDTISAEDAESWYVFWGNADAVVTIRMTRENGDLSPLVALLDADQTRLIEAGEVEGDGQAAIENYTLPTSGVYYINATHAADTTGTFTLSLLDATPQ